MGRSPIFARLFNETDISTRGSTVGDAFDAAFRSLRRVGQRDEYVYRAALTQNVLLGRHSLKTASMLNEFRVGACRADLVILNGTATVYEIKSERDSLVRLAHQVKNYQKIFTKIYIISSEDHISGVKNNVPNEVGIMCLSKRFQISTIRDADDYWNRLCPLTIFESLRSVEARSVLTDLGAKIPDVPNTMLHGTMREMFPEHAPIEVHKAMVSTLKRTRNLMPLKDLVDRLPRSLYAAALSIPIRRADHERLVSAVQTPLTIALTWS